MSTNIDQQIADLENQKKELEKKKIEEKKIEDFNKLKADFEGKVKCTISKRKASIHFTAIWYKQVVMKEDGLIYVPREILNGSIEYTYKRYTTSCDIINMSHYNCKIQNVSENDMFVHKKNLTIEQFEQIKKSSISYTESIFNLVQDKEFIKTILNGAEHDVEQSIEQTKTLLDVPHIILSQNEAWMLGTSVFLNDLCFLLTPASISFAKQVINKKIKDESNSRSLLSNYGYRHRNDRSVELETLLQKLEDVFKNIDQTQSKNK